MYYSLAVCVCVWMGEWGWGEYSLFVQDMQTFYPVLLHVYKFMLTVEVH